MVRRSVCEISKIAFTPLYCAVVRPHLDNAMEANTTVRGNINQLERVQRLATRLASLRHVPYEERLRQLNLFSLERRRLRSDLILALILTRLNSSSAHPEKVYEGTSTDYCTDQAVCDEGAMPFLSG